MVHLEAVKRIEDEHKKFIKEFRKDKAQSLNKLIVPTWRWLKVNGLKIEGLELPELKSFDKPFINIHNGREYEFIKPIIEGIEDTDIREKLKLDDFEGVSKKLVRLGETFYNSGFTAHIPRNISLKHPVNIEYVLDNDNNVVIDHNIIIAEENSEITIVIDIFSKNVNNTFHNGVTKVFAKNGATVNIIKIQRMDNNARHFDSNIAYVEGDAKVNWVSVEIGSEIGVSNIETSLNGTASEGHLSSIYFVDGSRKLDLSCTMTHRGMRSISIIDSKGALKDRAQKIFRGNLDFKRGSKRSKGNEEEYTLLLDKTVKADSIPSLLCEEHDVAGQHAASAGQVDNDKLYYLMSRGLNEKESKKLIVEASFRPIIDKIPVENIRQIVIDEVHRRLVYA